MTLLFLAFVFAASVLVGYLIGSTKGRGAESAALGIFLGPIGWIIALLLPSKLPPAAAIPARPRPLSAQKTGILIYRGHETHGPFTQQEIAAGLQAGTIAIDDEAVDNETFEPINLAARFPHQPA